MYTRDIAQNYLATEDLIHPPSPDFQVTPDSNLEIFFQERNSTAILTRCIWTFGRERMYERSVSSAAGCNCLYARSARRSTPRLRGAEIIGRYYSEGTKPAKHNAQL